MAALAHPPLAHFLAALGEERIWGEVRVRRAGDGFELRHRADDQAEAGTLRAVAVAELRALAQTTAKGQFRPLKSAPTLASGWRCEVRRPAELGQALQHLYPGSLADLWAVDTGAAVPVGFAEFVGPLEGRAGVLHEFHGASLAVAVAAACAPEACVKHRRWTAPEVPPDEASGKSALPCLEPCPLFLTFARTCAGIELRPKVPFEFAPDDLATLAAALRHALEHPPAGGRNGDFAAPLHPWRVSRLLARYRDAWRTAVGGLADTDESD